MGKYRYGELIEENRRKTPEYQQSYYDEDKYREIDSYLEKFEKILTLFKKYGNIKDIKYFQDFLKDFLEDPFSLIIRSLGSYKQKLKTIRKSVEEEYNGNEIFERDLQGNPKILRYVNRLEDKKLIEFDPEWKIYCLSENGKEIYEIITQLESFS